MGLIQSLRDAFARTRYNGDEPYNPDCDLLDVAADSIEDLVALLKRYRNETPLGHQPHMIAHLADAAIARAE